jgi:hypothetical protein
MRSAAGSGVFVALLIASQAAQAAPPASVVDGPAVSLPLDQGATPASLAEAPSNEDLQREYPRIALMMGLGANVSMACKTLADGRLDDCHVTSEEPDGMGFGAATVRTAVYFRVKPATKDGVPVEGSITIPLRWQTEGFPPPATLTLAPASPNALVLARQVVALQGVTAQMQARWRITLQQQSAELLTGNFTKTGQAMMAAFRAGLADAIQGEAERQAHVLASQESEADLKATISFLQSPPGRAWTAAELRSEADAPNDFKRRILAAAHARYCPDDVCPAVQPQTASTP